MIYFCLFVYPFDQDGKKFHTDEFSDTWNEFILSLRDQDLISNRFAFSVSFPRTEKATPLTNILKYCVWTVTRERTLLVFPSSMAKGEISVFQWPAFLLANKVNYSNHAIIKVLAFHMEALRCYSWLWYSRFNSQLMWHRIPWHMKN